MVHPKLACAAIAFVLSAACGSGTPTSPSSSSSAAPMVPVVQSGSWKGTFDITSCSGGTFGCVLSPESFVLRLGGDGTGVLQIHSRVWGYSYPAVPVNLAVQSSTPAATVLSGTTGPAAKNLQVELRLTDLSSTLQGTIHYAVDDSIGGRVVNDGPILFATRDSTIYLGRFQGNWVGYVERTQCAGDCTKDPIALPYSGPALSLAQSGAGISGSINGWIPLTGTATGNSLSATVHYSVTPEACRPGWDNDTYCRVELTMSATADSLDRLHGSIVYHVEGISEYGRSFALDATTSLEGIVRWPQ